MASPMNRAARRAALRRAKTAAVAGAGAAAMALGVTAAPGALPEAQAAIDINWDPAYTAGTLAGLIDFLGNAFPGTDLGFYNSGPPGTLTISVDNIPVVGALTLTLTLENIAGDTANLYNTVGSIPQPSCSGTFASNCRYAIQLATGGTNVNLVDSYRTQISSVVDGVTPAGYIPFTAAPNSTTARPTQTNQGLLFLNNPLRPNGGFFARFPGLSGLVGVDPTIPATGYNTSADQRIRLNTATLDLTWAYDPLGDFPVTFNPFSLVNSLFAALPINLAGGISLKGDDLTTAGLNLAAVLQFPGVPLIGTLPMEPGKSWYLTLDPNELPILSPLRLPSLAINAVLGALGSPFLLGTPLSDALEPALKILVNVGYDDVVTPSEGGTYNRTFTTSGTPTPFGSVNPLTPQEWLQVPGDVLRALIDGFAEQLRKPLFGIIVPANAADSAAATVPASASVRASVTAQAEEPKADAVVPAAGAGDTGDRAGSGDVAVDPSALAVSAAPAAADTPAAPDTPAAEPVGAAVSAAAARDTRTAPDRASAANPRRALDADVSASAAPPAGAPGSESAAPSRRGDTGARQSARSVNAR